MYDLSELFLALDQWVARENVRARSEGTRAYKKCSVRVLGQAALWAAGGSSACWPQGGKFWIRMAARCGCHAKPGAVLISKALKAPKKNQALITEYLAKGASERFFALARKYGVDLEQFV